MDTDSAYMAISAPTLEHVIKPEMMGEFRCGLVGLCDNRKRDATCRCYLAPVARRTPNLINAFRVCLRPNSRDTK